MGLAAGGVWWARLGCIARCNPACCMNSGPPWPGWCHRLVRAMPHLGDGHQPCDDPRDSRAGSNVGQWPDAGRQSEPGVAPGPSEMVTRIAYRGCQARPRKRPQLAVWRPGRGVIRTTWKWLSDGVLQLPGLVSAGNLVDRIDGDSHCAFWQPVSRTARISSTRRTPELLRPACRWPPGDPPRRCPGPGTSLGRARAGTHA